MNIRKIELLVNEYSFFGLLILTYSFVKFADMPLNIGYIIIGLSVLLLISLIIEKLIRENTYLHKLNLKSSASSTLNPTPGKSMLEYIEKQGYGPIDIKEIYMMSYSLNHQYLVKSKFAEIMKDVDFKLNLFSGIGGQEDITTIKQFYLNANVNIVEHKLIEHYNIIHLKNGKTFVWYEPDHIVQSQKDILKHGGYLFLADSLEKSKNKFFEIIDNQEMKVA